MEGANTGNHSVADTQHRASRKARGEARQVVLSIWTTVLAVWIALIPIPAHASLALHQHLAIPGVVSDARWHQPEIPLSDGSDPTEPQPDASNAMYLPDLHTLPPSDLHIQLLSGGRRFLRLANTIWNSGQGPLELTGELNTATNQTRVYQHFYTAEGDRGNALVGEFVWHPTHNHWHLEDFTLYELWTLQPDQSLGKVVASSEKLSYCLRDTDAVDRYHTSFSPRRGYWGCDQRRQGLSVGWGDIYKSTLDGQALDITGLPDSFYALTSTVNPNGVILEEDYSNNSALVYLEIIGERLAVVTLKQIRMTECEEIRCK